MIRQVKKFLAALICIATSIVGQIGLAGVVDIQFKENSKVDNFVRQAIAEKITISCRGINQQSVKLIEESTRLWDFGRSADGINLVWESRFAVINKLNQPETIKFINVSTSINSALTSGQNEIAVKIKPNGQCEDLR